MRNAQVVDCPTAAKSLTESCSDVTCPQSPRFIKFRVRGCGVKQIREKSRLYPRTQKDITRVKKRRLWAVWIICRYRFTLFLVMWGYTIRLWHNIHKVTMTSFAITLCGQCCRRHVVGQRVVNDISVVCSCWSICSLCSESNNANLLLCLPFAVLGTSILLHIPNITWPTTWRRVLGDHEYGI